MCCYLKVQTNKSLATA